MLVLTAHTKAEMIDLINATQEEHCAKAFALDCRIALRWTILSVCAPMRCAYEFVVLSPGDKMPPGDGWEIWEDHSGIAMGRPL